MPRTSPENRPLRLPGIAFDCLGIASTALLDWEPKMNRVTLRKRCDRLRKFPSGE